MIEDGIRRLQQQEPTALLGGLETDIWNRLAARRARKRQSVQLTALQAIVLGVLFTLGALAGQHFNDPASRHDVLSVFSTSPPLSAWNLLRRGNS